MNLIRCHMVSPGRTFFIARDQRMTSIRLTLPSTTTTARWPSSGSAAARAVSKSIQHACTECIALTRRDGVVVTKIGHVCRNHVDGAEALLGPALERKSQKWNKRKREKERYKMIENDDREKRSVPRAWSHLGTQSQTRQQLANPVSHNV